MPPKKQQKVNKKTEQKAKEKIIEDKTFGLKNKKGNKQQNYIKSVQHQVKYGNQKASKIDETQDKKKQKDQKKKEQDELNQLFRPIATQKVQKGVDPKSVVCAFFKQGTCGKGDRCKFSHDLALERKSEKRSVYDDGKGDEETMDDWDEATLKDVVEKKHAEADKKGPKTTIVCKHFLKAIEESKYGWFWDCPSGEKCIYKHALPPGFVFKKKKKDDEPQEAKISLEELIEEERAKLGPNQTKITLDSFRAWKKRKIEEKRKKLEKEQSKKKKDFKEGKSLGITGREVFQFNPDMITADDDGADDQVIEREEQEDSQEDTAVRDLTAEALASEAIEASGTGTVSTSQKREGAPSSTIPSSNGAIGEDETSHLGAAAPIPAQGTVDGTEGTLTNGAADIEVDEELFDEDLDNLDEELEGIDLE